MGPGKILFEIAQGSTLAPRLFLLCINDMPQGVKYEILLYVHGTCLIFQRNDITQIEI